MDYGSFVYHSVTKSKLHKIDPVYNTGIRLAITDFHINRLDTFYVEWKNHVTRG
jgi:hypothetical protein